MICVGPFFLGSLCEFLINICVEFFSHCQAVWGKLFSEFGIVSAKLGGGVPPAKVALFLCASVLTVPYLKWGELYAAALQRLLSPPFLSVLPALTPQRVLQVLSRSIDLRVPLALSSFIIHNELPFKFEFKM